MKDKTIKVKDYKWVFDKPTMFLTDVKDKRYDKFIKFKNKTGFTPDECWSLDGTIVAFTLPRLIYFRNNTIGYPAHLENIESWYQILDTIIWSFKQYVNGNVWNHPDQKKYKKYVKKHPDVTFEQYDKIWNDRYALGYDNFGKYITNLWW